jgi:hypothetical protein
MTAHYINRGEILKMYTKFKKALKLMKAVVFKVDD